VLFIAVFSPFSRAHASTTGIFPSTGRPRLGKRLPVTLNLANGDVDFEIKLSHLVPKGEDSTKLRYPFCDDE
jgi:hypothetical protein